jgi:hypothetical protein
MGMWLRPRAVNNTCVTYRIYAVEGFRLPFDRLRMRGSMVHYVYGVFFFALQGEKEHTKSQKSVRLRKP